MARGGEFAEKARLREDERLKQRLEMAGRADPR